MHGWLSKKKNGRVTFGRIAHKQLLEFQWSLERKAAITKRKSQRLKCFVSEIDKWGNYATSVMRVVASETRNRATLLGLRFLTLDLDAYGGPFSNKDVFSTLDMYAYDFLGQGQVGADFDERVCVLPDTTVNVLQVANVFSASEH